MKLKNVSKFFDKTKAVDAYNAFYSFKCQVEPLDMYRTEGTRIKIRNMSTAPGVTIPARRVIKIDDQAYIVSDSSLDHWSGEAIRSRYVLQGADHVVEIRTISQVLEDVPGVQAYASIDFNKYGTDERDSSRYHPQYHIYFGKETVEEDYVVHTTSSNYLVKNSYLTPAGIVDAICNELDDPVIDTVTFKSRTYIPITDSFTESSSTIRCIRIRWQDKFTYLSQGSEKFERGDIQVLVPSSVTPKAADVVDLSDGPWRVLSVVDYISHKSLHLRRA
jgi:hypothetical protein